LHFAVLFDVFTFSYDMLWLFSDNKHKARHIGPDVINGCDRQTDEYGDK